MRLKINCRTTLTMQHFSTSPAEMIASPWRHRGLLKSLIVREVAGRYRGSILGILWSLFNPLLMLSVYTFVFGVIFAARWTGGTGAKSEFALILFAGLLMFNFFAECFSRAPTLIIGHANYVKKVVFPLEILPWMVLGSSLFHLLISLVVWVAAYLVFFGLPNPELLYLPLILIPFSLFTMGVSWFLASLGVYLRDVAHITSILTTILMFLSAIFFPLEALPPSIQSLSLLNPLIPPIEMARQALFFGKAPSWSLYAVYFAAAALVAWLGFAWFQKTRRGFADVL
jgi:lipopolysaccharide transport system permease protein